MYALFERTRGTWKRISGKEWESREDAQKAADHLNMIRRGTIHEVMEVAVWSTSEKKF